MRTALSGLLLALWMLVGSIPSAHATTPVGAILGGALACDPDNPGCQFFPTQASLLCDGTGAILDCPQFFAPDWVDTTGLRFFGITNRVLPPLCVQSTNGGSTWGLCPTNPFSAAVDDLGAVMTVASDGSLVVAANQGANNCIIRRSTDYGSSWSTVFTDTTANVSCGIAFGTPTPSFIRCADANAYCVVIGRTVGSFALIPYFSTDNGASWTKGASFTIVSTDEQLTVRVSGDGSLGHLSRYGVTYTSTQFGEKSGNVFIITGAVPLPPGAGPAASCTGALLIGTSRSVICGPDNLNINTYRRFSIAGGIVTFNSAFTLQNAPAFANAPTLTAVGFNSTTAYIIGRNLANTQLLIHITRDTFSSAPLLATITPTTVLIPGCCTGDLHVWNGKVYFTDGGTSSQAVFGRIQ